MEKKGREIEDDAFVLACVKKGKNSFLIRKKNYFGSSTKKLAGQNSICDEGLEIGEGEGCLHTFSVISAEWT